MSKLTMNTLMFMMGCTVTLSGVGFSIGDFRKAVYDRGFKEGYEQGERFGEQSYIGLPRSPRFGGYFRMIGCFGEKGVCVVRDMTQPGNPILMDFRASEPAVWKMVSNLKFDEHFELDAGTR